MQPRVLSAAAVARDICAGAIGFFCAEGVLALQLYLAQPTRYMAAALIMGAIGFIIVAACYAAMIVHQAFDAADRPSDARRCRGPHPPMMPTPVASGDQPSA